MCIRDSYDNGKIYGLAPAEFKKRVNDLGTVSYTHLTHLAMADSIKEQDIEYTQMQLVHFSTLIARLQTEGITIPALHVQSSYGIINYRQLNYNYARPGIALYGAIDSRHVLPGMMPDLKPVFALKTRISTIKELSPGEGAGYDLAYTAKSKRRIAMLTIGYADGIPRSLSELSLIHI